jgi:hypothetical protein
MEVVSLESLLSEESSMYGIPDTIHGIGEQYKNSPEAFYEIDEGAEDRDVEIVDRDTIDKTIFRFIWNRGKSNRNTVDTGDGKFGFSFYYARHAYGDPYKVECKELAKGAGNTAYLARIRRLVSRRVENPILIVQAREDPEKRIRIISAYYRDDSFAWGTYYNHYEAVVGRNRGFVKKNRVFEGAPPELLEARWEEYQRRQQIAFEKAQKNK